MRNVLVCLGLIAFVLLSAACSRDSENPTITVSQEDRVSQASDDGTIQATLNRSQFDSSTEFLLTISNSTKETIALSTSTQKDCYADTFWFYAKTELGWQPKQPLSSFVCASSLNVDRLIPGKTKTEFSLGMLLGSRGLLSAEPADYILKTKYLDSTKQAFYIFTNEFSIGTATSIDRFLVSVENSASDALNFTITNGSEQTLWLAPFCSSVQLNSGWVDDENSTLQRLTNVKSWAPIRAPSGECMKVDRLVEIGIGETKVIDGSKWIQDAGLLLQSGIYRWDIVFYLHRASNGKFEISRHVFGDIFEYKN